MPSKGLMVLVILLVAGGIAGLSQVDFHRDVPHYPPGYADMVGGNTPVPIGPGRATPPDRGDQPLPPDPEPEPETDEIRIRNVKLTKLSSEGTTPVTDPDDGTLVRIDLYQDGKFRFRGIDLGDWDFLVASVRQKVSQTPNAHIVIIPDRMCPWQYVNWVMEIARDAGVTKIGIGGYPDGDEEKTLLVELAVSLLPKGVEVMLPSGMDELDVTIKEKAGGKGTTYEVYGQDAAGLYDLYTLVSSFNGDYADEYSLEYSKDVSKSPWVVTAPPKMATGHVLVTLDAIRRAAVYTVRFGGEFPPPPGKGK